MEEEPLAVTSLVTGFFDFILDLFRPLFTWLDDFGWAIGDWTFFMPILFWIIYKILFRLSGKPWSSRTRAAWYILGFVAGGIFEYYQPLIESMVFN